MDSSYHIHDAGHQPCPAVVQMVQLQVQQQQEQQQQQLLQQQPSSTAQAPLLGHPSARDYFVRPPPIAFEQQQQQQQGDASAFNAAISSLCRRFCTGPRGAAAAATTAATAAAAAAAAAQHQLKQSSLRRLLLCGLLLLFVCFLLLHAIQKPQTIAASLSGAEADDNICRKDYRDKTLKLSFEAPASSLFAEGALKKFEASDVVSSNKCLYFVSDSSFSLMKATYSLTPLSPENQLIGPSERNGSSESDWEALWLDEESGVFYIVREAVTHNPEQEEAEAPPETEEEQQQLLEQQQQQQQQERSSTKPFHAHVEEVTVNGGSYTLQNTCKTEFSFSAGNKGFEGLVGLRDDNGEVYLLGLCEGNFCKGGEKGRQRGNGRMVLMKKETKGTSCIWRTLKVLELPSEVHFADYSAVAVRGNLIVITSQEDSRLWLGRLNTEEQPQTKTEKDSSKAPPTIIKDPMQLQVLPGGTVLHFPRGENCEVVYCNIEGIAFVTDRLLAAVSDKMKRWQDYRCYAKGESVHLFTLPSAI